MSAGLFQLSRYAAVYNASAIHPIRVQPETIAMSTIGTPAVTNAAPTGAVNNPISAIVSRSNRSRGLIPRRVRLRYATGTLPTGYDTRSVTVIPILNATFAGAVSIGTQVTYLGATWTVVGVIPERVS